jgi:hypothetical protein
LKRRFPGTNSTAVQVASGEGQTLKGNVTQRGGFVADAAEEDLQDGRDEALPIGIFPASDAKKMS